MKKHLFLKSLLIAIGLLIASINTAWAGTKRVYCQVTNSDWLDAGAKVNVHYWGGNSAGTTWPGAKMTASGTANVYYADIPDDATFCFARVNGGNSSDYWGHKTSDLSFPVSPASGLNLYEITGKGEPSTGQWANIGFESAGGNDIKYYYSGNAKDQTWDISSASGASATKELGTITSLYLKGWDMKMYQNMDAAIVDGTTNRWLYYNIHRSAVSPGDYSSKTLDSWTWPGWSDGYRKPYGSKSCNENLLEGLGSGKYSMTFYLQHNGLINFYLNNGGSNYNLKWTIGVPAVSGGNVTSNGTGNGAEGSPFSVADGKTITFTAGGSQASTDANSVLYVKWGNDEYAPASSTTKTITPTTTKQSMTVKLKYYNSADGLSGAETTLTIWYQSTVTPSIGISSISPSPANSGDEVTITASRQNAGTTNITYQYSTDNSNWTTIGSATSSTTQAWTTPAVTSTTTYYVKASMSYGGNSYSDTKTITVYGKKVIKVKNTNGWSPFYMHRWGGDRPATSFPGDASQISAYGTGQWKQVVLYSSNTSFIFVDGTNNDNKNSDQTYAGVSDGGCYEIASGTGTLALNSTANCPAKPSVSVSAATNRTNNAARINGNISSNGNDNITDYGFYWSKTYTTAADLQAHGTKVQKGTSNYTGDIYQDLSSLTASNTIYYIVYATNGQGTQLSSVESFVVPYKVTISKSTGCNTISPSAGTYYYTGGFDVTATRSNGYTFNAWSETNGNLSGASTPSTGTNKVTFTPTADNATITATYTETTHTVTLGKSGNGHVEIGGATVTSVSGVGIATASGTITAVPDLGYYFTGWTGDINNGVTLASGTASSTSITICATADSKTITANFAPIWYLKGDFNSWGEGNPIALASATSGSVTLTTTSAKLSNSKFKIWNKQTDTYYQKESQSITRAANTANSDWTEGGTSNDMKFTSDVIGDYIFAVTFSSNIPSALTVTYPTAYTVTFEKGTGGSTITASATSAGGSFTSGDYVASGDNVTFTQTASSGYTFSGWYTTEDAGGSAVSGMGVSDNVLESVTENKTVWSRYTANNYTVTFDENGGTTTPSPSSKSVTFGSAYGALPTGMTHTSKTFVGWYTDSRDGNGDLITAETTVSTASNHTLYAHYENVYSVNVDFKCGDAKVYPSTSVEASPTSLTPTITAPEIFGYTFVNWTGTNVTPASATSATTTITATAATTITANYNIVPTVYFKNNLGWENVYVTFDAYFDGSHDNAPGNYGKPYFQMTQIGTSDIYYCAIPSTYTTSDYAGWAWNIAFDNTGFSASENVGTKTGAFDSGEFTGRGDFDPKTTLFIPYNGDTETRNSGKFYKTGCWIKYNSTESGYQVNMNKMVTGENADTLTVQLTAANAGGYEFSAKLNLKHANYSYGFKLYKIYQKNTTDLWYTNTGAISAATDDLPWHFWAGSTIDGTTQRCALHTEALGDYTITVSFATGRPEVDVEYPTQVGDWRLAYNDRIAWSYGTHDANWYLYSSVIKAKTNAKDIASFYVSKADGADASIELQKCIAIDPSNGAETWEKQGVVPLSSITKTGFYNFQVTQDGSKEASAEYLEPYNGNFYIRTDASDGGWSNYKSSKNLMTYSEFSDTNNKGFTHYFMRYVTSGSNIKFCIANDYNPCVTEYCVDDDFTDEWIEADGNVRFMWNQKTNAVSRAYISGSSVVSDRFLVLEGDSKLFNEAGNSLTGVNQISGLNENEMKFTDDQNWIYEATIKAQPTARVKLTAKFNNQVQYFYGKAGEEEEERDDKNTYEIIGGSGSDKYKLRIVYDFKIDRLVSAFLPEGDIKTDLAIHADMMIIRKHQEDANQVTFGLKDVESGKYGSLSEVKTVYGAMQFNKWTLNSKSENVGHEILSIPASQRGLYWISFPFNVNLSDVFGFGTYGRHWIIEEYNGAKRATDGYWADSDGFWEFVTNRSNKVLEAGKGYVLALDLDLLTESSDIWANNVENVYLYFPSSTEVENIERTNVTITVDPHPCSIDRTGNNGADINKNRTIADSHWNIIGVPSYANYGESLYSDEEGEHLITWQTAEAKSLPYLYQWNMGDNTYSVQSGSTYAFKSMHAYMVQYHGDIYWKLASATPVTPSVAARQTDVPDKEYMLSLIKDSVEEDHTYVRMSDKEGVTAGFEFGQDLCKEYNGNKGNIYTFIGYLPVAGNSQPHPLTTTIVPVGVKIAANGEYTFSMSEGTNGGDVWLIDNANSSRTNLGLMDYTVNLTTGTYEGRFSLEFPVQNVVTDIDNDGMMRSDELNDANDGVRKVFVGGRLYILRDGKAYDATGAQVR